MTNRISPFAALTGAEKQIKWLEYQSVRLPYIHSGMEEQPEHLHNPIRQAQPKEEPAETASRSAGRPEPTDARRTMPQPPPEIPRGPARADFQKSRHSQYDAVIARMKQAELQAHGYRPMS